MKGFLSFLRKVLNYAYKSYKNIDAKLYLLKIHKTDDKTKKLCYHTNKNFISNILLRLKPFLCFAAFAALKIPNAILKTE